MGKKAQRKNRPTIVIDEHIHPVVATVCKERNVRSIRAASSAHYKGRPDIDYLAELNKFGGIFVTADMEFVTIALPPKADHAGIVLIPSKLDADTSRTYAADFLGRILTVFNKGTKRPCANLSLCYFRDGLWLIERGKWQRIFVWDTSDIA